MATYLSQPYQGSEFVSGVPIDLITKVGMMKQMKYDQTVSSIQGSLDELGQQDIIKDSERNYVSNKLSETVNQLNQFGGVDLTDGPTASRLKSYVSNLKRDPRIYNAIADTRAIRNNIAQLAEIKEKRPAEYAAQNEALFMQGINSYLSAPEGTRYSGQTYIPYYNYDENYRKIATEIQKNPDIQADIQYTIAPDGTKRARSTQEIKQVTKEKIQQALLQAGDTRALRQMQIDYQFTLPNKTVDTAVQELKSERDAAMQQLKEAKDLVAQGISDPNVLKSVQNVINNLQGDGNENAGFIKQLDGKIAEVRATGDPTKYYSFDKYVKDYTSGLARSYAYEQKGKIDYDDMFIEDYKHLHNLQLEQVKASIALEKEKAKTSGSSADLEGFTDSFTNTFFNIEENPNREGNIDDNGMYALFDATKNTDGSGTITLGQGETFLNLGKVLEANGIVEQNSAKINGYSQFTRAYNDWTKTKDGQATVQQDVGLYSRTPRTVTVQRPKSIEQFLSSEKGKQLAAQVKTDTGLDVSNNVDVENLKRFANSPDAIETIEFGNKLTKLRGQVRVRPMDGMNIFAGNNSQYYGKMQGLFTQAELENAIGEDGFDKLREKGIIEETLNMREGRGNKDDQPLYSLPLVRKVEKDIGSAYTNYMTTLNSGDNFYTKNLPGYQSRFKDNFDAIVSTRGLNTQTLVSQGQTTLDNLAKVEGAGSTDGIQKLNWIRNQYNRAKAVLDSNVSSSADKVNAKKFLQSLITNSQTLSNFAPTQTTTTPEVTSNTSPVRQPGQTIAEYANNPGNLKFKGDSPVIRLYGGSDSGVKGQDGGTFARFPDMSTGFNAYKAQLFGPTDGLFKSDYYQPWKTVDQALKSYSNYRTEGGRVKGYSGDIYPEVKNKKLEDLTQAERDELTARMLKIENNLVYEQLRSAGVIKT